MPQEGNPMLNIIPMRSLRYMLAAPIAASLLSSGLSADKMAPQTALMILIGALFAGWVLHGVILGLIRGLFSFWTPLIILGLIAGGPSALSALGS